MATTSNRSSGSQVNKRGVAQGVTLVDPNSGLPISTVTDLDGTIKLAVDASVTATIGDITLNPSTSGVYIADKITGYKLKINADGSIDTNVEIDATDGDNIAIHDSAGHELGINTDGSINSRTVNTLITVPFDYIAASYPTATTEIYTYKTSGSSGTTVGTVTVIYSDSTKNNITSVAKT